MCQEKHELAKVAPLRTPPIMKDPKQFLVLPMPRPMMGTIRVDGTRLRVRACRNCGCNTTIPLCPVCGELAEASRPPDDDPGAGRLVPRWWPRRL